MTVRKVLDRYEGSIKADLDGLSLRLEALAAQPYVSVFSLDDEMLARTTQLALQGLNLEAHDLAILSGVLVTASRLWARGEQHFELL